MSSLSCFCVDYSLELVQLIHFVIAHANISVLHIISRNNFEFLLFAAVQPVHEAILVSDYYLMFEVFACRSVVCVWCESLY